MYHANQMRRRYEEKEPQRNQLGDLFELFELPPPPQMGGRRQSEVQQEQSTIESETERGVEAAEASVAAPCLSPTPCSRYGRPQRPTNRYQAH